MIQIKADDRWAGNIWFVAMLLWSAGSLATTTVLILASPYTRIGGLSVLCQITNRFYDLMETDLAYAALRAMHAPDLAPMRGSLAQFLAGWSGGPQDWWEANPDKCMVSLHGPFAIGRETAAQWAEAMCRAIAAVAPADREIADGLAGVLQRMALGMAKG